MTRTILSSWKEIAQCLGKGVRTVQRWELEFGLPVRRPKQGPHKAVLAIREEIDAWLQVYETMPTEMGGYVIHQLKSEVDRLRTENAALRLRLEALASGAEMRKVASYVSHPPSATGSRPMMLDRTREVIRKHTTSILSGNGDAG